MCIYNKSEMVGSPRYKKRELRALISERLVTTPVIQPSLTPGTALIERAGNSWATVVVSAPVSTEAGVRT